jgi:hypothetical protein
MVRLATKMCITEGANTVHYLGRLEGYSGWPKSRYLVKVVMQGLYSHVHTS